MSYKKINEFAEKYLSLYKEDTTDINLEETFADECFSLGFEMDYGQHFIELYSRNAFDSPSSLDLIIDTVDDVMLLGSAIFSKWRFVTHWTQNSLSEPEYREWFVIALQQLASLSHSKMMDESEKVIEQQRKIVVSRFSDMEIDMDYLLCIPSIHAKYKNREIVIDYGGELRTQPNGFPQDKIGLLIQWVKLHREEIKENHWRVNNYYVVGKPVNPIKPLEL